MHQEEKYTEIQSGGLTILTFDLTILTFDHNYIPGFQNCVNPWRMAYRQSISLGKMLYSSQE